MPHHLPGELAENPPPLRIDPRRPAIPPFPISSRCVCPFSCHHCCRLNPQSSHSRHRHYPYIYAALFSSFRGGNADPQESTHCVHAVYVASSRAYPPYVAYVSSACASLCDLHRLRVHFFLPPPPIEPAVLVVHRHSLPPQSPRRSPHLVSPPLSILRPSPDQIEEAPRRCCCWRTPRSMTRRVGRARMCRTPQAIPSPALRDQAPSPATTGTPAASARRAYSAGRPSSAHTETDNGRKETTHK
ncbi:putative sequence-specific DNA binding protein [Trypanosoma cruzi Dm28c]|uniref:Putative sequence-specific DNA binding protein n=1 Tax=Trypanosoma cruzi Dm28c TaxID=1416333 RepID=V5BAI7_TRYCR|nr:putative sequence-specific DNA binding protein [Trypanosoma cruzi Dm28c]